jgi:hypothetical protein
MVKKPNPFKYLGKSTKYQGNDLGFSVLNLTCSVVVAMIFAPELIEFGNNGSGNARDIAFSHHVVVKEK